MRDIAVAASGRDGPVLVTYTYSRVPSPLLPDASPSRRGSVTCSSTARLAHAATEGLYTVVRTGSTRWNARRCARHAPPHVEGWRNLRRRLTPLKVPRPHRVLRSLASHAAGRHGRSILPTRRQVTSRTAVATRGIGIVEPRCVDTREQVRPRRHSASLAANYHFTAERHGRQHVARSNPSPHAVRARTRCPLVECGFAWARVRPLALCAAANVSLRRQTTGAITGREAAAKWRPEATHAANSMHWHDTHHRLFEADATGRRML